MTREAFEVWISAPPYERSIERQGENGSWPGQYRSYETQAAWEAWQESARQEREACIAVIQAADDCECGVPCDCFGAGSAIAAIRARKG